MKIMQHKTKQNVNIACPKEEEAYLLLLVIKKQNYELPADFY